MVNFIKTLTGCLILLFVCCFIHAIMVFISAPQGLFVLYWAIIILLIIIGFLIFLVKCSN